VPIDGRIDWRRRLVIGPVFPAGYNRLVKTPDPAAICAFCRRRPAAEEWRPFCSERCKLQDLARWADGAYRVPGERLPEPDDSETKNSKLQTEKPKPKTES
jgi:hypothetical protein